MCPRSNDQSKVIKWVRGPWRNWLHTESALWFRCVEPRINLNVAAYQHRRSGVTHPLFIPIVAVLTNMDYTHLYLQLSLLHTTVCRMLLLLTPLIVLAGETCLLYTLLNINWKKSICNSALKPILSIQPWTFFSSFEVSNIYSGFEVVGTFCSVSSKLITMLFYIVSFSSFSSIYLK